VRGEYQHVRRGEEEVAELEVAVDHVEPVEVVDAFGELQAVVSDLLDGEALFFLEREVHLSFVAVLEQDVEVAGVFEAGEVLDDVFVFERPVDADLFLQRAEHAGLSFGRVFLVDHFERGEAAFGAVAHFVDEAVGAAAVGLDDLVVLS